MEECSFYSTSSLGQAIIGVFDLSHFEWCKMVSQNHFDLHDLHSPMVKMLNISLRVFQPFEIFLLRILCLDLYPIFNWIFGILMLNFFSSLYILEISPL